MAEHFKFWNSYVMAVFRRLCFKSFPLAGESRFKMWSRKMTHCILRVRNARRIGIVLFSLLLLLCFPAQAKRKDLVIMKNGDHLTGEVKKLEHGVLYVDLDYVSGSVGLDWLQVEQVQSTGGFQVILENGSRMSGT